MIQTKHKALAALIVSAAGFAAVYPQQHTFWGGLMASGCLAALIGGLADWFAVTALFKKPLGISYRTAIIPRNRERMLHEIIQFTSKDLLNPRNIMKIVRRYDMVQMLIFYLEDAEGKKKVTTVIHEMLARVLATLDVRMIGAAVAETVKRGLREIRLAPILAEALRLSAQKKYDEAALRLILQEAIRVVRTPETHGILTDVIEQMKAEYEKNLARRQAMSLLLDLSPEHLADLLQGEMSKYLENMQDPKHFLRHGFQEWFCRQMESQATAQALEEWKDQFIATQLNLESWIAVYLEKACDLQDNRCFPEIDALIEAEISALKANAEMQAFVDRKIKSYIQLFVREQHAMLTQIIRDRLSEFSNESLVAFIESRVADDLQMIRINGSLVGSLVGMVLYTIAYWAERLW